MRALHGRWPRHAAVGVGLLATLLLVACESSGAAIKDQPATSTTTTAATTESEPTPVPPGAARLAFADDVAVYVLRLGDDPVEVSGYGDKTSTWLSPVWSTDGRFLAWSTAPEQTDLADIDKSNEPYDTTIHVLDTISGKQAAFHDPNHPLSGDVLAVTGAFVAVISGENNLGKEATDFVVLRTDAGPTLSPRVVHSALPRPTPDRPDDLPMDMAWVDATGDHLYVVVTEASGTRYRYSPELWRVELDGTATRLFGDCDRDPEGCVSNLGFRGVAVSPDGSSVAFEAGARTGCDAYPSPELVRLAPPYRHVDLVGAPMADGDSHVRMTGASWAPGGDLLIALQPGTNPQGEDRCNGPKSPPPRLFRCSPAGRCNGTGIAATSARENASGDLAYVRAKPDIGVSSILAIRTATGDEQEVIIGAGTSYAWAP